MIFQSFPLPTSCRLSSKIAKQRNILKLSILVLAQGKGMKRLISKGFTLIEVVIFIVILGIASAGILLSFETALRATPENSRASMALNLTQGRINIILGQYYLKGYSSFSDICTSRSTGVCALPSGYSVNSTISVSGSNKTITVTTSYNGTIEARLATIVSDT